MQLGVDPPNDRSQLRRRNVDGQGLDGFNIVIGLHASVGSSRGRSDLDQRTGIKTDDRDFRAWVGVAITPGKKLQKADPDLRFRSDSVLDRVGLHGLGPLVAATPDEEGSELDPDGLGVSKVVHLDVVGHEGIGLPGGGVLNEQNAHLATHEQLDNSLNITNGSILPGFSDDVVRNPWSPLHNEAVLKALILQEVRHLGIDRDLVVDDAVEAAVVLFKGNHAVFEESIRLAVLDDNLFNGGSETINERLSSIEETEHKLEPRVGRQQ